VEHGDWVGFLRKFVVGFAFALPGVSLPAGGRLCRLLLLIVLVVFSMLL